MTLLKHSIVLLALVAMPVAASAQDGWRFGMGPYIWATGIDGDLTVRGQEVPVEVDFGDIMDAYDGSLITHFQAQNGRYGFDVDLVYLALKDKTASPPLITAAKAEFESTIAELNGFVEIADGWQVLGGIRYVDMELELNVTGGGGGAFRRSDEKNWVDPFIGVRTLQQIGEHWYLSARADIGGFGVESDFAWNATLLFGYEFGKERNWTTYFGYRALDVDYDDGDIDGFGFDATIAGPVVGIQRRFGSGWK